MADYTGKYFQLYKDAKEEWRWRLRAEGNHKVIATSGEGYKNKANCIHGAKLVASVATGAPIWNVESEAWEV